jgi:hypothetical protein
MGFFKSKEERHEAAQARDALRALANHADGDPGQMQAAAVALRALPGLSLLSKRELRMLGENAFRRYAEVVLEDDVLSAEEEDAVTGLADALGIEQQEFETRYRDVRDRLYIARVNDGRLPALEEAHLMVKPGEVVHLETAAVLLKEVVRREYRGGYSGVSFRVAKGVRFHTGGFRGRSVVVGGDLVDEDGGILSVSSKRIVFLGDQKTIEIPYGKLANVDVFSDGIRFHVSNRQRAPLFRLGSGQAVAATVNAAFQKFS